PGLGVLLLQVRRVGPAELVAREDRVLPGARRATDGLGVVADGREVEAALVAADDRLRPGDARREEGEREEEDEDPERQHGARALAETLPRLAAEAERRAGELPRLIRSGGGLVRLGDRGVLRAHQW